MSDTTPTLRRELGTWNLTLAGVGNTIGAGIFVITGTAAAQYAGPAVTLSFLLGAVACICTGLCYGELSAMMPQSGGAYSYTTRIVGRFAGWMVGWCLVLEYLVSCSTVAVGWSSYFTTFMAQLGWVIVPALSQAPLTFSPDHDIIATGALFNVPAAAIVLILGILLIIGVRETARANVAMVVIKCGVILLVIGFGASHVDLDNWTPFIPPNEGTYGEFGFSGVLRGAGVIFFAFVGFDGIANAAAEARDPQRDIGRGILFSLLICTALYVGMALVMTGLADYRILNVASPVTVALAEAGESLRWLMPIVSVGAIVGLASAILMGLYSQTRIFYNMSQDGLLPGWFQTLSARFCTPHWGTALVVTSCAFIAGLFPIDILGELVSSGVLLAFTFVCAEVLIMRRREPALPRVFRVPFSPAVPILGIVSSLWLMVSLPEGTWIRLGVWLAVGAVVYATYGMRRARR